MAKFETVPLMELKTRLPAKLLPLVEEYKEKLEKPQADQGAKLVLEKGGEDAKGPSNNEFGVSGERRVRSETRETTRIWWRAPPFPKRSGAGSGCWGL